MDLLGKKSISDKQFYINVDYIDHYRNVSLRYRLLPIEKKKYDMNKRNLIDLNDKFPGSLFISDDMQEYMGIQEYNMYDFNVLLNTNFFNHHGLDNKMFQLRNLLFSYHLMNEYDRMYLNSINFKNEHIHRRLSKLDVSKKTKQFLEDYFVFCDVEYLWEFLLIDYDYISSRYDYDRDIELDLRRCLRKMGYDLRPYMSEIKEENGEYGLYHIDRAGASYLHKKIDRCDKLIELENENMDAYSELKSENMHTLYKITRQKKSYAKDKNGKGYYRSTKNMSKISDEIDKIEKYMETTRESRDNYCKDKREAMNLLKVMNTKAYINSKKFGKQLIRKI